MAIIHVVVKDAPEYAPAKAIVDALVEESRLLAAKSIEGIAVGPVSLLWKALKQKSYPLLLLALENSTEFPGTPVPTAAILNSFSLALFEQDRPFEAWKLVRRVLRDDPNSKFASASFLD